MAEQYVGVLLEYASAINPEPGVPRAPTHDEQVRAIDRMARRFGGRLIATVTSRQGTGLDRTTVETVVAAAQPAGLLMLTIDALRVGRTIDVEVLDRLWGITGEIGFLIEDEHFVDDATFEDYIVMVMSMNHVRARDASPDWRAFVGRSDRP
jgi:hypothetical protein